MGIKEDASAIIQDVLRVQRELGRIPSRIEYQRLGKFPGLAITETFGSYALMLKASGLEYTKGKRNRQEIRLQAFEHLKKEAERVREAALPPQLVKHALVIGDRHKPYHHMDSVPFLLAIKKKYDALGKPFDLVADIGDGEDFHAMSFHDHDPDLLSPGHELEAVIQANQPLYEAFPVVKILESNHGSMVYRKGKHHGIPRHVLKDYREILQAPVGYTWHPEVFFQATNGSRWLLCHSYGGNVLLISQKRGMSVVQGHLHSKFSIQAWANAEGVHFAVQTGCLVDDTSLALAYNKTTVERPIMGSVRIEDGIPHLLPMLLDKKGRWTGFVP